MTYSLEKLLFENYVNPGVSNHYTYVYEGADSTGTECIMIALFNKSLIDEYINCAKQNIAPTSQLTKLGKKFIEAINDANNNDGALRKVAPLVKKYYMYEPFEFEEPQAIDLYGADEYRGDLWMFFASIDGMIKAKPTSSSKNSYYIEYTAAHIGSKFGPLMKDMMLSHLHPKIMVPDRGQKEVGKRGNKKVIPSITDAAMNFYKYIRNKNLFDKYDFILMDSEKEKITSTNLDDLPSLHNYNTNHKLSAVDLENRDAPIVYNPALDGILSDGDLYDIGVKIKQKVSVQNNNAIIYEALQYFNAFFMEFGHDDAPNDQCLLELIESYFGCIYKDNTWWKPYQKVK